MTHRYLLIIALAFVLIACIVMYAHPFFGIREHDDTELASRNAGQYEIWVTNQLLNKIQIVDGDTLSVIAEIDAGKKPHNVVFSPDRKSAWVANVGSGDVSVIDTTTRAVIATIPSGTKTHYVALTSDGKEAWVVVTGENKILVFDTSTRAEIASLEVGRSPAMVAFSPNGRWAYVSNGADATLSVVDTLDHRVVKTIEDAGGDTMGVATNQDGSLLFATGGKENRVSTIDTDWNILVHNEFNGKEAHSVAATPDGREMWVPNRQSGDVSIYNASTGQLMGSIPGVGDKTDIIAFSPDGARAFVTTRGAAQTGDPMMTTGTEPGISVIDVSVRALLQKVPLGGDPHGVAVLPLSEN